MKSTERARASAAKTAQSKELSGRASALSYLHQRIASDLAIVYAAIGELPSRPVKVGHKRQKATVHR